MDQLDSSSSSVALIIAFLTLIIIAIQICNYKISPKKNLPPGPWKLPIIGNMHQLLMNPLSHRCLAELAKKHGPVMYLKLGELANVVVSSRRAAEEVMRTNDILLAQRPVTIAAATLTYNCKDIAFSPYGDYWRQVKKICVVHLTSMKQVESFRSVRETEVAMFVRLISSSSSNRSPVNLSKMLFSLTTNIISRATFGDLCERVDAFAPLLARISNVLAGFSVADLYPSVGVLHKISGIKDKAVRLHQDIDDVLVSVIDSYKASKEAGRTKAGEILGVLLDLQDQNDHEASLSTESIKAILLDVLSGGIETTSTTVEWAMSELVKHPEIMRKVQEEVRGVVSHNNFTVDEASVYQLKYIDAVIKETLRLHPPLPLLFPREAQKSLTICGYEIPQKTRVLVNAWAIGRDPEIWKEPDRFFPERFLTSSVEYKGGHLEFIPFGSGRRMCPGMMFAMYSAELTLANLLSHFDWELPGGLKPPECLDMSEGPGLSVRRKHDLCLSAIQYRR